jgi:asparagine synthase (glutamine-hydrolysing)
MRRDRSRLRAVDREKPGLGALIEAVKRRRLTYLELDALCDLAEAMLEIERLGLEGAVVEAGCGLGGSAIVLAGAKARNRELLVFDAFGMIPPPTERDAEDAHRRFAEIISGRSRGIGKDTYYGYEEGLYEKVVDSFHALGMNTAVNNVRLVKGLFENELWIGSPVAFAHIDADWYDSVRTCLERIEPYLAPGGRFVLDDYDHWAGARAAVDDYFADRGNEFDFVRRTRLHVVRR